MVFKERLVKKLTERYIGSYIIEEVVLKNIVELKLLVFMKIHPVVVISKIIRYREPVKGQRIEKPKLVKVNIVEE